MVISKLPGAITDNTQRIKAVNHWERHIATKIFILLLHASNKKICNFLIFCQILMIFLPKCRSLYVVLEKGHGAREKGMALEKKGMGLRHAKMKFWVMQF